MTTPTLLLLHDELVGFARSRVMLVLWAVLPVLAILGYLLIPAELVVGEGETVPATVFMSLLLSSLAGTVAALLVAVDLVTERNRHVYDLFAIRPIRREAIVWAKFLAVFGCVTVACLLSLAAGMAVDALRGAPLAGSMARQATEALISLVGVIALSAGVGVLFGVLTRSVLVAVLLILYFGQNLAVIPMLPVYFGVLPDHRWILLLISFALAGVLLWAAGLLFRRSQL